MHYRGVGYSLLAVIVERVTTQPFGAVLQALVLDPLGIEAYVGVEPPRPPVIIDVGDSLFAGTELEFYNSAFFRSLGEPTSGLITTAAGALQLVRAFYDSPSTFCGAQRARPRPPIRPVDSAVELWGGLTLRIARGVWALAATARFRRSYPRKPARLRLGTTGPPAVWPGAIRAQRSWAILGTQTSDTGWDSAWFPAIGAAILASAPAYGG